MWPSVWIYSIPAKLPFFIINTSNCIMFFISIIFLLIRFVFPNSANITSNLYIWFYIKFVLYFDMICGWAKYLVHSIRLFLRFPCRLRYLKAVVCNHAPPMLVGAKWMTFLSVAIEIKSLIQGHLTNHGSVARVNLFGSKVDQDGIVFIFV